MTPPVAVAYAEKLWDISRILGVAEDLATRQSGVDPLVKVTRKP